MKNINEVFHSVCEWNEKRYDRVNNAELLVSLLNEELDEYFEADSGVEKLDALCDIMYVAMGGLWKLEVPSELHGPYSEQAKSMMIDLVECCPFEPVTFIRSIIESIVTCSEVPIPYTLHMIIRLCEFQMYQFGLNYELVCEAMTAVCKSNDSKSIKKTASDSKANDGDKGAFYVSPTAGLTKVLEKAHVNHH